VRAFRRALFLSAAFVAAGALLFAAAGSDPEAERRSDLSRLQARIAALKAKLTQSEQSVATLAEELKRLDLRLEIAEREEELLAATREDLGQRLAATAKRREEAAKTAARTRRVLVSRARVLHRFGRFGYFRVLLEARDVPAFLEGLDRLDRLARRDGFLLARYREAEKRLAADLAREEALKAEIDRLHARSRREKLQVASLQRHRQALLARERGVSASRRREVVALSDKAERLERLLETLARSSEGQPVDPGGGVRPWKGVLDWPARGTLVETFGRHRHPKFDAWTVSNGISLALPASTSVRAVYAGRAVYARWLAEYGNLVILDHGDGVFTLYAWLQGVAVSAGSYVPTGAPVGWAGVGPGREEAGVYFEIRDRQKAADPIGWLR